MGVGNTGRMARAPGPLPLPPPQDTPGPRCRRQPQVPLLPLHRCAPTPLSSCLWDLPPQASSSLGRHMCISTLLANSTGQVQHECQAPAEELLCSPPCSEGGQGMELQHVEPQSMAGPHPALVTNSHCCPLCGCGAETQEKPALAPNRAAGDRAGSEFESRSLMPRLARASQDF